MTRSKHKRPPSAFLRKHESSPERSIHKNELSLSVSAKRLIAPVIFGSVLYFAQHIAFRNRVENATI